jgi:hypothetical protein
MPVPCMYRSAEHLALADDCFICCTRGVAHCFFFVYNGFGKINDGEYIGLLFAATAKVIGRRQNVVYI